MGGFISGPKPQAPPPPPPPPERDDSAVQDAARAERRRQAGAKGRASTILTSGQGVTEDTPVVKKTLLGE